MYRNDDVIAYRNYVRHLCLYSAEVQRMTGMLEKGGQVNKKLLVYALSMVKGYRIALMQVMNRMGIGGSLDFMEDNEFIGFSVRQGRLILEGSRKAVLDVCRKWIDGFPDEANYYQYAVGMYCLALAYADTLDKNFLFPEHLLGDDAALMAA